MNKTETAGFNKVKASEATKKQIRNQMLDLDLIKLPSIGNEYAHATKPHIKLQNIGTCDTGKNSIPSHQIIQPAARVPAGVNLQSKDDYKQYFNPMLNKTRIDNLPPLQEMSVLDQSYESKRKQTANQQLRSRSKNYYNLENCNYPSGTMNECKASNNKLEESKSNMPKPYKSPTREHKRLQSNNTAIPIGDREVVVDTSISVVSSIGGSGKEILINTANTAMKSSDNCV
ncbi:unnamed protein product [Moneuplotes crassus]|uniref:Uncharacterized protein n=1 Tax=Euplotes crassus TaxID=5936 RepID=A0AAD1UIG2_EUPCR|nr:unnamed protein product [Moneuplotes crassus]